MYFPKANPIHDFCVNKFYWKAPVMDNVRLSPTPDIEIFENCPTSGMEVVIIPPSLALEIFA